MYPILYDVANEHCLNNVLKERAFRDIGEEADMTGV